MKIVRQPRAAFSYYGGKQIISKRVVELLPAHTVYVEPFAGGLSVLFAKNVTWPNKRDNYREIINDLDSRVVNFFRILQDKEKFEKLKYRLENAPFSREIHREYKRMIVSEDIEDQVYAWFYKIHTSFSAVENGGFSTAVFGTNLVYTFRNKINFLELVRQRLLNCVIEHEDALEIIKRYDAPQTCFYLDPPYVDAAQGYFKKFTKENLLSLIELIKNSQGSFVLSGYENDYVPIHWKVHKIKTRSWASCEGKTNFFKDRDRTRKIESCKLGNREREECLWVIDRSENMRKELRSVCQTVGYKNKKIGIEEKTLENNI